MIFDALFSMWEGAHFFAGFCHQAVVLWAAFFDAGFTSSWAKRGEIPCDAQEHIIYHGVDCFWFHFHAAHGMGELAQGIKATFRRNASVFSLSSAHQRRLRASNALERVNQEIKRRTRVASLFPNEASLLRLVSALLCESDEERLSAKSYLNMNPADLAQT